MRIEACLDFFRSQILAYIFILAEIFIEIFALEPSLHGVALYPAICGIAVYTLGYQSQQYARAVNQAAGEVQVSHHLVRVNQKLVNQVDGFIENEIQRNGSTK